MRRSRLRLFLAYNASDTVGAINIDFSSCFCPLGTIFLPLFILCSICPSLALSCLIFYRANATLGRLSDAFVFGRSGFSTTQDFRPLQVCDQPDCIPSRRHPGGVDDISGDFDSQEEEEEENVNRGQMQPDEQRGGTALVRILFFFLFLHSTPYFARRVADPAD